MTAAQELPPLVTVIMPVFNGARTLRQSVHSVLDQTGRDLELIVVDDPSADGTAGVVEELAEQDARVRLVRRGRRGGPAPARNSGIASGAGRDRARCDADGPRLAARPSCPAATTVSTRPTRAPPRTSGPRAVWWTSLRASPMPSSCAAT